MNITERWIEYLNEMNARPVTPDIINMVKKCLIDYLGCAYYGEYVNRNQESLYLNSILSEHGNASVIGRNARVPAATAALINGFNAHTAELDDGHRKAMLHPGSVAFSALLAVAQEQHMSVEKFICGIIMAYEATISLGQAIQPGHKMKGFHATGTCGTIGAAVGLAYAMDYTTEQLRSTVSASATSASGLLQLIDDGSELKPYNIGRAALDAVMAFHWGKTGMHGPGDPLGGERGFFNNLTSGFNEEKLLGGNGKYRIEEIYRKPYAACRHCHAPIEAALKIQKEGCKEPDTIEKITILTYKMAIKGHDHNEIHSSAEAKMSIPFSVATALVNGEANFRQFDEEAVQNKDIRNVIKKISVLEDPDLTSGFPEKRSAVAIVRTDGRTYQERVDYPLGEPENPMTEQMLTEKSHSLMKEARITEERQEEILRAAENLEDCFEDLLKLI